MGYIPSMMINDYYDSILHIWLVVTGTFCFHSVGNFIIPIDEVIFFRGVGIPPTRVYNRWDTFW